jgi:hypothetical protein
MASLVTHSLEFSNVVLQLFHIFIQVEIFDLRHTLEQVDLLSKFEQVLHVEGSDFLYFRGIAHTNEVLDASNFLQIKLIKLWDLSTFSWKESMTLLYCAC